MRLIKVLNPDSTHTIRIRCPYCSWHFLPDSYPEHAHSAKTCAEFYRETSGINKANGHPVLAHYWLPLDRAGHNLPISSENPPWPTQWKPKSHA